MITVKCFRSPFLILLLFLVSCTEKETGKRQDDLLIQKEIGTYVSKSYDTNYSLQQRKFYIDKAIGKALKSGKDNFISGSYTSKYALLSQAFPDSIPRFLKQYYHRSVADKDTLNIATAQGLFGDYYNTLGKSDSAFAFFNEAKTNFEYRNDSLNIVYRLLCMADIYNQYNDNIGLENVSTEALRFSNNKANIATIYNNLGIVSRRMYNDGDAIKYYNIVVKESKDSLHKAIALNNIAVVYNNSHNYAAAEKILSKLKDAPFVIADARTKARVWCNLGYAQMMSGNPNGISLLQSSEAERLKLADSTGLVSTYIHLAEAYKNNPNLARQKAMQAYAIATALNSPDDRVEALTYLAANSDDHSARRFYNLHLKINDSITGIRQAAKNQFAKIRYDSRREKDENQKLKTERVQNALEFERKKRQNDILYTVLAFMAIIGVMLYLLLRKKHRREKIREAYKTETRIAKKIHDELANDLFNAMTFADSQDLSDADKKETLVNNLDSAYSRSRDIARDNNPIDTGVNYANHLREMLSEYSSPTLSVIIRGIQDIPWESISENKKNATWRVLQEIMVNMKKHSQADITAVRFECIGKMVNIHYSDNGIGITANGVIYKNGLRNVENRIEAINGTVTFDLGSGKGLKITIAYPVKN